MLLRTAPGLAIVHSPHGLTLNLPHRNIHLGGELLLQRGFLQVISRAEKIAAKRELIEILRTAQNFSEADALASIDALLREEILIPADAELARGHDQHRRWSERGWSDAFLYSWVDRHLKRVDYTTKDGYVADNATMEAALAKEPAPPLHKELPQLPHISFVAVEKTPQPRQGALSFEEFSWLTHLAYGQTATRRLLVTGDHVAKTSPSGGSRHPTEIYPVVLDVAGVNPGIYHYNVKKNGLEQISAGDPTAWLRAHVICHPTRPNFRPRVVYVYSTIFKRSMFRYREPFSYRVMHHDIGHLMTTTSMLLSALGRPSYSQYALHEREVAEALGLDGLFESPMAFSIAG